jgi:transcription initiation factor TFIIIB Brf1 subunit/transcription initiation factor TFIIB
MKEITEEDMRDQLQKDDKRHHKNQELADIYTLLGTTVTDIMIRFANQLDINTDMFVEIHRIVDYANECLADVAYTYSSPKIVIDNDMRILRGAKAIEYIKVKKESIETTAAAALTNSFV